MNKITTLIFLGLIGITNGQNAWDSGDLSFDYGSPFPDETVLISGDFLSSEIPNQGVGGIGFSLGDTSIVSCVAYDIHVTEGDTLADIFVIFLQDSTEIGPGYHIVGFGAGAIKLFVWLQDVDPAMVITMLDTSFNLDSLSTLNAYVSLSGQIEISELNETSLSGNFAGAMMNTDLNLILVNNGVFSVTNTLPALAFSHGSLELTADTTSVLIEGALNPLLNNGGVGAVTSQQGDTLTTNLFGYIQEDDETLTVYGMVFQASMEDYPEPGAQTEFTIGLEGIPFAFPYVLKNAALEQVLDLLDSDSLPSLIDFENLYLPISDGSAIYGNNIDEGAFAVLPGLIVSNSAGDNFWLTEVWQLSNAVLSGITEPLPQHPVSQVVVGNAYPNPFNSSVVIPFELTENSQINMLIYNMLGQEVGSLMIGNYLPGGHHYQLNMDRLNLAGGLYYFSLHSSSSHLGNGNFIYLK
ncbi:hypothetical protein HQ531_00450 [bacterium]|nr:hypothetical protein [bacterium]